MTKSTTTLTKRSTVNGAEQTYSVYRVDGGLYEVPSYVVLAGSLDAAAKELGLRILGRREAVDRDDAVAEIHERGGESHVCVAVVS